MEDPQLSAAASFCQSVIPLGLTDVIEAGNSSSIQYLSAYFLPQNCQFNEGECQQGGMSVSYLTLIIEYLTPGPCVSLICDCPHSP